MSAIDQSLSHAIDGKQPPGEVSQLPKRAIICFKQSSVVAGGKTRKCRIFA